MRNYASAPGQGSLFDQAERRRRTQRPFERQRGFDADNRAALEREQIAERLLAMVLALGLTTREEELRKWRNINSTGQSERDVRQQTWPDYILSSRGDYLRYFDLAASGEAKDPSDALRIAQEPTRLAIREALDALELLAKKKPR